MSDMAMDKVDEHIEVEISKDRMLGVISFTPAQNGGRTAGLREIKEAISGAGIMAGMDEEEIADIAKNHIHNYKYVIAKGKAPKNGEDGKIEFGFDVAALKELKPKIKEDGTADLRDLGAVKNVKKGDVLATKIHAKDGEDGYNVLGQELRGRKGKEPRIPKGKNTELLEDGVTLVAGIDGKLEYDDHNIYINSVYNVMSDLDSSVGNIDFVGDVVIYGNVNSGFQIKAGGSVEVKGAVEDAVIIAGSDIILSYGIQGTEKSKLVAGGNIITKFIQNAVVEANGNITTEAIMHSNVTSGDSIHADMGKGLIVGGKVAATNLILAKNIGSHMGTVTELQIGMPPSVYAQYREVGQQMREKAADLNKVDQGIKFLISKLGQGGMDPEKKKMLDQFNSTRVPLSQEYEELRAKYKHLGEKLENLREGIIKASGCIYPGVKVTFGNLIKYVDDEYPNAVVRKSEGEIVIS